MVSLPMVIYTLAISSKEKITLSCAILFWFSYLLPANRGVLFLFMIYLPIKNTVTATIKYLNRDDTSDQLKLEGRWLYIVLFTIFHRGRIIYLAVLGERAPFIYIYFVLNYDGCFQEPNFMVNTLLGRLVIMMGV